MSKKPLRGQVAIITGASRGIGRDIALLFANAGANIVVAAKTTSDNPKLPGTIYTVAKEVEALGVQCLAIKCDVRQEQDINDMVQQVVAKFNRIDILVNNAGALWWTKLENTPMGRYDLINQVNARATFMCSKAVIPVMARNQHGHIINMSPPIDLEMVPGRIAYCISKFGMSLVAIGLGEELKGTGIACNALWPATMVESFATKNFQLGDSSQWRKASILSDCCLLMVQEDPNTFTGQTLIDEDYLRTKGVTNFDHYRCDPNVEPARIIGTERTNLYTSEIGLARDRQRLRSKL